MTDYAPFDGRRREDPAPSLIRECWRLLGPSGKPIVCAIYEHPHGVEAIHCSAPERISDVVFATPLERERRSMCLVQVCVAEAVLLARLGAMPR